MESSGTLIVVLVAFLAAPIVAALFSSRWDALTLVTAFLVVLFLFPQRLVFGPLGGIGQPALLVALGAASLWVAARALPDMDIDRRSQPSRVLLLSYAAYMALGYSVAHSRALTELERTGSIRGTVYYVAMVGLALMVADGTPSRKALDRLAQRLVAFGAAFAGVGILQFLTGIDPVPHIRLPGLRYDPAYGSVLPTRGMFNRPYSTADHPIEFGVVCAVLLPLALHLAWHSPPGRTRWFRWSCVLMLALGVPMSVSRSGIVAIVVALSFLSLAWDWRRRVNMAVATVAFTGVMWLVVPGLTGTLRGLFLNWGTDISVQGRRERVPAVMSLLSERPILGRGTGTYSVEDYFVLDNQVHRTLIESGILGLGITAALLLGTVFMAWYVGRMARDQVTAHLAHTLAACLLGIAISTYTFTAFFYRIFTGVMFVLIGAVGTLWRLERESRETAAFAERKP